MELNSFLKSGFVKQKKGLVEGLRCHSLTMYFNAGIVFQLIVYRLHTLFSTHTHTSAHARTNDGGVLDVIQVDTEVLDNDLDSMSAVGVDRLTHWPTNSIHIIRYSYVRSCTSVSFVHNFHVAHIYVCTMARFTPKLLIRNSKRNYPFFFFSSDVNVSTARPFSEGHFVGKKTINIEMEVGFKLFNWQFCWVHTSPWH